MNSFVQVEDYYKTTMYLNVDCIARVDETGLSDNCVIVYLTLEKPKDSVVLHLSEWERIKPMIGIVQSPLEASADDLKVSPTPVIEWIRVEIVERDSFYSKTSSSRRAMWRLITDDGRNVNLFDHADMLRDNKTLLRDADYLDIFVDMAEGQHDTWTVSPIEIELQPDGSFWKVKQIKPRAAGAGPDFTGDDPDDDDPDDVDEIEMFPAVETDLQALVALVRRGNFVILDTETTGLGDKAEICSIAIIDDTGKTLLDTLVRPVRGIPADATRIHGITDKDVQGVRGWLNLNQQVWDLLYGRDVIIYNADYDLRLLIQSEKACDPFALSDWSTISRVCAMNAYAEHVGDWNEYHDNYKWHKLTDAARTIGYQLPEGMKPHGALADCLMTLAVCRYLVKVDDATDTSEAI